MQKQQEVLILRNSICKMLYDVVLVDYEGEQLEYIAKAQQFEESVAIRVSTEEKLGLSVQNKIEEVKG